MSNSYDQRKEDPQGFYSSAAVICGMVAIGGLVSGGPFGAIGLAAGVAALVFWRLAKRA